jgi:hypothetical protein
MRWWVGGTQFAILRVTTCCANAEVLAMSAAAKANAAVLIFIESSLLIRSARPGWGGRQNLFLFFLNCFKNFIFVSRSTQGGGRKNLMDRLTKRCCDLRTT